METTKEINIKNQTFYFYTDIYYFDYVPKKKISECNVINSVNLLYLRIVDIKGQFEKGKDDAWHLVISDKDNVYKKLVDILESIKNKIIEKTWDVLEYDKDYMKIKFESNNVFPTGKDVNIHLATTVIFDGLYKNVSV